MIRLCLIALMAFSSCLNVASESKENSDESNWQPMPLQLRKNPVQPRNINLSRDLKVPPKFIALPKNVVPPSTAERPQLLNTPKILTKSNESEQSRDLKHPRNLIEELLSLSIWSESQSPESKTVSEPQQNSTNQPKNQTSENRALEEARRRKKFFYPGLIGKT